MTLFSVRVVTARFPTSRAIARFPTSGAARFAFWTNCVNKPQISAINLLPGVPPDGGGGGGGGGGGSGGGRGGGDNGDE